MSDLEPRVLLVRGIISTKGPDPTSATTSHGLVAFGLQPVFDSSRTYQAPTDDHPYNAFHAGAN